MLDRNTKYATPVLMIPTGGEILPSLRFVPISFPTILKLSAHVQNIQSLKGSKMATSPALRTSSSLIWPVSEDSHRTFMLKSEFNFLERCVRLCLADRKARITVTPNIVMMAGRKRRASIVRA